MIAWTGNLISRNFGVWVLEHPTSEQVGIFRDANFLYRTHACFAPPKLVERAGGTFYANRRACAAVNGWLRSRPPPLLISFAKEPGIGVWVLRNPTPSQLQVFYNAGIPIHERPLGADPDLMQRAGATHYPDFNVVPEYVSTLFAPPTRADLMKRGVFGWPKKGGVWALIRPTLEQFEALERGGYDFRTYDSEDRYHGLLETVGARFYANPEDVKAEVEESSPNFELGRDGERGGRSLA